mgnify:CR=1 FL=1
MLKREETVKLTREFKEPEPKNFTTTHRTEEAIELVSQKIEEAALCGYGSLVIYLDRCLQEWGFVETQKYNYLADKVIEAVLEAGYTVVEREDYEDAAEYEIKWEEGFRTYSEVVKIRI